MQVPPHAGPRALLRADPRCPCPQGCDRDRNTGPVRMRIKGWGQVRDWVPSNRNPTRFGRWGSRYGPVLEDCSENW